MSKETLHNEEMEVLDMIGKLDFAWAATAATDPVYRRLIDKGFVFERPNPRGGFDLEITDNGRTVLSFLHYDDHQ